MGKKAVIIILLFFCLTLSLQALPDNNPPEKENMQAVFSSCMITGGLEKLAKCGVEAMLPVVKENLFKEKIETSVERVAEKGENVSIRQVGVPHGADLNKTIQEVLKEANIENKKIAVKALQNEVDTLILIYSDEELTNIKAHTIEIQKLEQCKWNFDVYCSKYNEGNEELLKEKLKVDEVLVLSCAVPEGIPLNYVTWDNMSAEKKLWLIQYNGR